MKHKTKFQAGVSALNAGRVVRAEALFRSAFAQDPRDFNSGFNLAIVSKRLGRTKLALRLHERLGKIAPQDFENVVALGNLYAETKQLDRAMSQYYRAIKIRPDDPRLHYNVGITHEDRGERRKALRAFTHALTLRANFPEAAIRKARLLEEGGRKPAAVRTLDELLATTSPQNAYEVLFEKSCLLARMGRFRDALVCLKSMRKLLLKGATRKKVDQAIQDLEKRIG